jgi:hypothetical protein
VKNLLQPGPPSVTLRCGGEKTAIAIRINVPTPGKNRDFSEGRDSGRRCHPRCNLAQGIRFRRAMQLIRRLRGAMYDLSVFWRFYSLLLLSRSFGRRVIYRDVQAPHYVLNLTSNAHSGDKIFHFFIHYIISFFSFSPVSSIFVFLCVRLGAWRTSFG